MYVAVFHLHSLPTVLPPPNNATETGRHLLRPVPSIWPQNHDPRATSSPHCIIRLPSVTRLWRI